MRRIAAAAVLASMLAGCLDAGTGDGAPSGPVAETMRHLARDAPTAGEEGRRELVIVDAAAWRTTWDALHEGCADECPAFPAVDFSTERVLLAQWQAPDPCHATEIVSATTDAGRTSVVARMTKPPATLSCIAVVAYPWAAAAIPRRDSTVAWSWETATGEPVAEGPDDEPPTPEGEPGEPGGPPVPIRDVARGQHSAISELREVVVETEGEWAALWTEHGSRQDPPPERPAVDFARERVLAVYWGERASGGHIITIAEVVREGDDLVARVIREIPRDGGVTTVMTQPFHMVAIPAGGEAVAFRYSDA